MARTRKRPDTYAGSFDAMSDTQRKVKSRGTDDKRISEIQTEAIRLRSMLAHSNLKLSRLGRALKKVTAERNYLARRESHAREELGRTKVRLHSVIQQLLNTRVLAAEKDLQIKRNELQAALGPTRC